MQGGIQRSKRVLGVTSVALMVVLAGCATTDTTKTTRTTKRDKTAKGAAIGAGAGAAISILTGRRQADKILAGAAIGAGIGAGVGAYMDAQEEKFGHIPGTHVERVAEDMLLVHFDSDILFAVDSSSLATTSRGALDEVSGVLNEYSKTAVVVQGHTDSTGSEEHNQALSDRRAESVKNYLVARGVERDRMAAIGHGESSPRASNATEGGKRLNRRVDILLKAKAR